MTTSRRIAALALCVPALALGACGGDSDEDKINSLVQTVAEKNENFCNPAYIEQSFIDSALGGVENCKTQAGAAPESDQKPKVSDLKVDGDSATATVTDKDGPGKATFKKDGDDWKVLKAE